MPDDSHGTITRLLREVAAGSAAAESDLIALVYDEIHSAAARFIGRERFGHTWQPTDLVGEVCLRLFARGPFDAPNRRYFFGAVARAMRQALIDHARKPHPEHVALDHIADWFHTEQHVEVIDLDDALAELAALHPRHHRVVTQKVLLGRSMQDIALDEACSLSTIEKDWTFARGWLRQRLEERTDGR